MTESVALQIVWRAEDLRAAQIAHLGSRGRIAFDAGVALALVIIGVVLRSDWFGILFIAVGVFWLLLAPTMVLIAPWIMLRRGSRYREPSDLVFSDEGIHFKSTSIDSRLRWNIYNKAVRHARGWLLYYGWNAWTTVPDRAFPDDAARARFDALVSANIAKVERR